MPEDQTRTPMERASHAINATDSSTLALRGAARMFADDGETGALLQLMYEQSAEQDDHNRILRRDQIGGEG